MAESNPGEPTVRGFPGLPPWLDFPLIKRKAEEWGVTEDEARKRLWREGADDAQ